MEETNRNRLLQAAHDVTLFVGMLAWVLVALVVMGRYQVSWQSTQGEQFTQIFNAIEEAPRKR